MSLDPKSMKPANSTIRLHKDQSSDNPGSKQIDSKITTKYGGFEIPVPQNINGTAETFQVQEVPKNIMKLHSQSKSM